MGKVLIAITCMTLMSTHASKLDNLVSGYRANGDSRAGQRIQNQGFSSVSGVRSNDGSTFNTRNPTFNSFNQASSGSFGSGGISSSVGGSQGSLNLGAQGFRQGSGFGAPQGSGLNFGSLRGPASQGSTFNAAFPGLTFTGLGTNFNQIPNTLFIANSGQQGSTQSRLRPVPSFTRASGAGFGSNPLIGSNFGTGSTTISLSPISFENTNSQSSTSSGFGSEIGVIPTRGSSSTDFRSGSQSGSNLGDISASIVSSPVTLDSALSQPSTGSRSGSEFSVSPARGSFNGQNVVTGIQTGNLQSTTRFSSDPVRLVTGSQRQRFNTGSTSGFNAGSTSGFNTGSTSGFNAVSNSGFNADSTSGFNAESTSGFNAGSTSGFNAGSTTGYNAGSTSGFNAGSTSGFNTGSTSGFNAGSNSRFNTGSTSGINAGSTSGFNAGSTSDFIAGSTSGFNAGSNSRFSAGSNSGFNADSNSRFNPGSSSGFNAGSTLGSSSFDFGQSSGITGGLNRGYLPPSA